MSAVLDVRKFPARFGEACRDAGLGHNRHQATSRRDRRRGNKTIESLPTIGHPRQVGPVSWEWQIWPTPGSTLAVVDLAADALAQTLGVARIQVLEPPIGRPPPGTLLVHVASPFPARLPWAPPRMNGLVRDGDYLVDLGVDTAGRPFGVRVGHVPHLLIGGTTGSGKSVTLNVLAATAACMEGVEMWGIDAKYVELTPWEARFARVACSPDDIADLLECAVAEMDRRKQQLLDAGVRDLDAFCAARGTVWCEDMPWVMLIIDEAMDVIGNRDEFPTAQPLIRRLLAQGRAMGIQMVVATQSPHSSVLPTTIRSNLSARWCGLTEGPHHTEVILGSKDHVRRAPAHDLPPSSGEAYWPEPGGQIRHVKSRWIGDTQLARVIELSACQRPDPSLRGSAIVASRVPPAPTSGVDRLTIPPMRGQRRRLKAPEGMPADRYGKQDAHRIAAWETWGRPDETACQACGEILAFAAIRVGLLDGDRANTNPDNLVGLCEECMGDAKGAAAAA